MKKLPIGIQSFEKLIEEKCIYVDKTHLIYQLLNDGNAFFIARPRRFGKSLLLDTIKCIFEGKQELFKNLFIYDKWNWQETYPVINISFGAQKSETPDELKEFIINLLNKYAEDNNFSLNTKFYYEKFSELIEKLYQKYKRKVVVLVDEYDKPILDNIENIELANSFREILKGFYQIIKEKDAYLKFVLITGVSKFSKVSLFSGLNNLRDITLNKQYATICGYTDEEMNLFFQDYLKDVDTNLLKYWYNGYSWGAESVYNPFDVLFYLSEKEFKSYWFQTGTPSFLIKILTQKNFFIPQIERIIANENILSSFDVDNIHPVALLFQTGYITIKEVQKYGQITEYILSYPNAEVKIALNDYILQYFIDVDKEKAKIDIYKSLLSGNIPDIIHHFRVLFASIPYHWYNKNDIGNYEGFYSSIFYSTFYSLGLTCIAEDISNKGRIDLCVSTDKYIYIFEFKIQENFNENKSALQQIKEKNYHEKYLNTHKSIYLIGIHFSKNEKNIIHYDYEKIN